MLNKEYNKFFKVEIFMEQKIALELKNITKTFGKVVANKNVSLKVRKGEILSILGENGSGKTTTSAKLAGRSCISCHFVCTS